MAKKEDLRKINVQWLLNFKVKRLHVLSLDISNVHSSLIHSIASKLGILWLKCMWFNFSHRPRPCRTFTFLITFQWWVGQRNAILWNMRTEFGINLFEHVPCSFYPFHKRTCISTLPCKNWAKHWYFWYKCLMSQNSKWAK